MIARYGWHELLQLFGSFKGPTDRLSFSRSARRRPALVRSDGRSALKRGYRRQVLAQAHTELGAVARKYRELREVVSAIDRVGQLLNDGLLRARLREARRAVAGCRNPGW